MRPEPIDLLDLTHGALHTALTEEGELRFARFTEEQKAAYAKYQPGFEKKCDGTAGVILEFISDTDHFSFDATFSPCTTRHQPLIDLLVDGLLYDSRQVEEYGRYSFTFSLPQGEHRITLCLPWRCITTLQNITLDDGAFLLPTERGIRILALGDSITQGSVSLHPSQTYVGRMATDLHAEVLNQGMGGYQFLKESLNGAPDWQPDLITLAYGTNDFSIIHKKEDFIRQVTEYMERLTALYPDTPILGITPIYRGDLPTETLMEGKDYTFMEALDALRQIYAAYPNVTVLDGLSFFPRHPDFFVPDYLHPNDAGFILYADAVVAAITDLLLYRR